jgi:hypothetical protein
VPPYLGPSHGDKKENRWQNHGKRKPLLTKMTTVQKVQESQKNQDNQKKAARKGSASIAKESQADRDGRGQADITELNE